MSTVELRKKVIAQVRLTKDNRLLRELARMLQEAGEEITPYDPTPAERKALKKGLEDIKKGRVIPAAKANKAIEKWLSK